MTTPIEPVAVTGTIVAPAAPAAPSKTKNLELWAAKLFAATLTGAYASGLIPTTGIVAQIAAIAAAGLGYLGFVVYTKREAP